MTSCYRTAQAHYAGRLSVAEIRLANLNASGKAVREFSE